MIYYTIKEINRHNSKNNCWIYANNNVYDVTKFIIKHPGGSHAIIKNAGQNCIKHYEFHSKKGKILWDKYKIGEINNANCCCIS